MDSRHGKNAVRLLKNNDDTLAAQLGSTQKLLLMVIQKAPRCSQKHVVKAISKDQGQIARAIKRLIELSLVVKKENKLLAQYLSFVS